MQIVKSVEMTASGVPEQGLEVDGASGNQARMARDKIDKM